MIPSPIQYAINDDNFTPYLPQGKSFGYVMAGNGVFKYAHNANIEACIKVSNANIRGLTSLTSCAYLTNDSRLPERLLHEMLADAQSAKGVGATLVEAMYQVEITDGLAIVKKPNQVATASRVSFDEGVSPNIVLDLHSHGSMRPFFSATDDRDEKGFRFYGVIGNLFSYPQIKLRIGIYGDYWEVPITSLFDSEGPFKYDHPKESK